MQACDVDKLLCEDMGKFFADPLGFVMYAYPWNTDKALRLVELPETYQKKYGSKYGPDQWAIDLLENVGKQVKKNGFDLTKAVDAIQVAVVSGHGVGKSAVTAWIVNWIMSTRPHSKGIVTAMTYAQLETKTWAEIAKWTKRSITGHWFNVTSSKGHMSMVHKQDPESWRCDAQSCKENNSESFAGNHAAIGTPFYIFDEASGVEDKIWEVSEGGLTDGEPMWFVFGNPTKNSGRFFEAFNRRKHRWTTYQIDSRKVQITNKKKFKQWVDDEGEDSDFVRVRVRGVFPRSGSNQFISNELTRESMHRQVSPGLEDPVVIGVDVARFGDDQTVIATRIGRCCNVYPLKKYRGLPTDQVAARVSEWCSELQRLHNLTVDAIFVDGGGVGGGVVDYLRALGYKIFDVQFGAKASDPTRYANKRAELWGNLKEWMETGALPDDRDLEAQLTSIEYGYTLKEQVQLERKEIMKSRGLASPDEAEAIALTLAQPVAPKNLLARAQKSQSNTRDWNPYAREGEAGYHPR